MTPTVQVGTILIDDEPQLTQVFALKSEPYLGKWSVIEGSDGFALDRQLHAAGWDFFFMAAEMKVMFFGAIGVSEDPERSAANLEKSKSPELQLPRSDWNRGKAFLGVALCHRLRTFTAHSAEPPTG